LSDCAPSWRRAKKAAIDRDTTLQQVIAEALEAYLKGVRS
jgi:hypothetical protein